MHSSISSSEPPDRSALTVNENPRLRQAIFAVIASLVLVVLGAEILSRYAFPRISQIEGRIISDEHQVMSIGAPAPGSPPTVLLVGNSLLLRGLDYPAVRTGMASDARVLRFVIENTEYLDWYYGLRHLFESGVRPSVVVVCLNLGQTVSPRTLGDYSARHLFGVSELLPVAHEAGMDATQTSGLILAHWSAFYASRATIRNFILNKTAPSYAAALHALADAAVSPLPSDEELVSKARTRLVAIDQLCRRYGVEFVLLIPPSLGQHDGLLASAAGLQGVTFDDPLPFGTLGPEFFRADRAHLNEQGAVVFTDAIVRCLQARLRAHPQE
jgi:hypothetical protein